MTYDQVTAALRARLESLVLSPALPIVWQNMEFKPETGGGESGWLYCEIELQAGVPVSFGDPVGGNTVRSRGVMVVNVVVPRGSLMGRAESVAASVISHFKLESVSGVHFDNRWIGGGRLAEQASRWFVLPVVLEFWSDRLETPV